MMCTEIKGKLHPDKSQSTSERSNTEFCSMDDNCIYNIFDWLSIKDLCRLKVTCKRLYLLTNEHYQRAYRQIASFYSKDPSSGMPKNVSNIYHKPFTSVVQKVVLFENQNASEVNPILNQNVKYLELYSNLYMDSDDIQLKNKLRNVKSINIRILSESILQQFMNLEYLALFQHNASAEKLLGFYPTLKQLDWGYDVIDNTEGRSYGRKFNITEMENFFQRHPNIKTFSSFHANKTTKWLLKSSIKFDDLVLNSFGDFYELNLDRLIEDVHSLHQNGQIKRLHLKTKREIFLFSPKLPTLTFLEGIKIEIILTPQINDKVINGIISLPNLKFLIFTKCCKSLYQSHSKLLAQNLDKLEEFHTDGFHCIDDLFPFVRYATKLKCILIISNEYYFRNCTTTLQMLNKKRRQLEDACKLTIYMDEQIYLHMKNNSSTNNYGLVEIKRGTSYPMSKHPLRPKYFS